MPSLSLSYKRQVGGVKELLLLFPSINKHLMRFCISFSFSGASRQNPANRNFSTRLKSKLALSTVVPNKSLLQPLLLQASEIVERQYRSRFATTPGSWLKASSPLIPTSPLVFCFSPEENNELDRQPNLAG